MIQAQPIVGCVGSSTCDIAKSLPGPTQSEGSAIFGPFELWVLALSDACCQLTIAM